MSFRKVFLFVVLAGSTAIALVSQAQTSGAARAHPVQQEQPQ
ncbi:MULTISPECIES: hypothetical protein [unclassified Leisingera]|nr:MULTISPECIES: hypothetical protein [unclassified Leisingera]